MTIYVKSVTSNGMCYITDFKNKEDLAVYAAAKADIWVKSRMTIDDILDALYDTHIATSMGSVSHTRISRECAIAYIRDGAVNDTWLDVKRRDI